MDDVFSFSWHGRPLLDWVDGNHAFIIGIEHSKATGGAHQKQQIHFFFHHNVTSAFLSAF